MELVTNKTCNTVEPNSPSYKPSNYKEMDDWLNALSRQAWTAIVGAYMAGGGALGVIQWMRIKYKENIAMWKDKDLRHFFACRQWSEFRTRSERT
jgi:hypothetical protein